MADNTTSLPEPTNAELLQSALCFIRSMQEHANSDSSSDSSPSPSCTPSTFSPSSTQPFRLGIKTSTPTILDRRRSSQRLNQIAARTYSPRSSVCPVEWDGKSVSGGGAARIYRLNPSPGERKEGFVPYRLEFKDD